MTTNQLHQYLNNKYGIHTQWPKTLDAGYETYANICNTVLAHKSSIPSYVKDFHNEWITVAIGPHKGIMYKDIEFILKEGGI